MAKASMPTAKTRMLKPRQPGDLRHLRGALWWAIARSEKLLADPRLSADMILKTTHALSQAAGVYQKLVEVSELELRVAALEKRLHGGT